MHPNRTRLTAGLAAAAVAAVAFLLPTMEAEAAVNPTRTAGADRFATAAEVSEARFAPGVPVAYLATGRNFPDALAASAASQGTGPVLLTEATSLPQTTAEELDRLNPAKVVALGGTAIISDSVFNAAKAFATGSGSERISGADRYDTAAQLSAKVFTNAGAVDTIYVSTGLNFPDALAGGPGVAQEGPGPLLLAQGGTLTEATKTELSRLAANKAANKIVVLGGTQAVPESVVTALDPYTDAAVVRVAGEDRFLTSVEVSERNFTAGGPNTVYLATGRNFPDALAGGAAAAAVDGPMLLTEKDCIPEAVNDEITRLDPDNLIVLGGTNVIGNAVLSRTECVPPASTTTTLFPQIGTASDGAACAYPEGTPGYNGNQQSPQFFTCSATPCTGAPTVERHWKKQPCPT